ncbi:MAG: nitrite reductase, partial [Terriglobia bacterium]
RHGWTAQTFLEEIERRLGFRLDGPEEGDAPEDVYRDHVGIHPQKQAGRYYAGIAVPRGRMTAAQMTAAADLADRYGTGELRVTGMQNLVVANVPKHQVDPLAEGLEAAGLRVSASAFWRGAVACTGTEFCKLAITETKGFTQWLVKELETRMPGFDQHLKIDVTGCPNGCGQHWIADLGLEGKRIKLDGQMVEAYYFCLGGGVGRYQGLARSIGYRCAAREAPEAIERLLYWYLDEREEGENFRSFCARMDDDDLRAALAGKLPPEREMSASAVPVLEGC